MRVVIQRVSEATVTVEDQVTGQINEGLLILLGIEEPDEEEDINWLCKKIARLRIFADDEGNMNRSVMDVKGGLLVVSQFTLHASTKKGNRPSFIRAARPETAVPLYEKFILQLENETGVPVLTGEFGAMMKVALINEGPVTLVMDSKNRE